jgi:hypothetical protein
MRPSAVLVLPPDVRAQEQLVKESDDLCLIMPWASQKESRHFVRGIMPVTVDGVANATRWGVWAEVSREVFITYVENARSPDRGKIPPLEATLANSVLGYPETLGLPIALQAAPGKARPTLSFLASVEHPFASEIRTGVTASRVHDWLTNSLPDVRAKA